VLFALLVSPCGEPKSVEHQIRRSGTANGVCLAVVAPKLCVCWVDQHAL
jgi:hypothetical protein